MNIALKILCLLFLTQVLFAADFMVIANSRSNLNEISNSDLKKVYLGQLTSINGAKISPSILPTAFRSTQNFINQNIGMSRTEFEIYWMERELSGQATPPKRHTSTDDMIEFIKSNESYIGIMPHKEEVPAGIKSLVLF